MNHDEAHLIVPMDAQKEVLPAAAGKDDGLFRTADRLPVDCGDDIAFGKAAGSSVAVRIDSYHKGAVCLPVCR